MKYTILFLVAFLFIACNGPAKKEDHKQAVEPIPVIQFTPLQTAVHTALTGIMTKEIESTGNTITTLQISGMEIRKISKKEYFTAEMELQQTQFSDYLQYLDKFSKTKSVLNDPVQLQQSKAKHNAVLQYLKKVIKKSSAEPEMYKVVYYLNATAGTIKYDQLKTTFLDTAYKKMVSDYSFLKPGF